MTLCLNMIVKNEHDVLERALKSVLSAVDEIVIVDTGSTDDTAEIARRYTEKVYSFEWINDFAAARNYALEKTESDYVLWLDADDVVPKKTAAAISAFMRGADGATDMVMLPYILDGGKLKYNRERIFKNRAGFAWQGRVHEVVPPHGNVISLPFGIVHKKPEGRSAGTRNLDIYRSAVNSGVTLDPREKYYYARELFFNGLYVEAAATLEEFLLGEGFYVNKTDACVLLYKCYKQTGALDKAVASALKSFSFGPPTGEACCAVGEWYFERSDYRSAAFWYECATRIKPNINSGAFIDSDSYGFVPLVWLSVCYDRLGEKQKAYGYHRRAQRLRPDHPSVIANSLYFARLGF